MDEAAELLEHFDSWAHGVEVFKDEGFEVWDPWMDALTGRWVVGTGDLRNPGRHGPFGMNGNDQLDALWNAWVNLRDNPQAFCRA